MRRFALLFGMVFAFGCAKGVEGPSGPPFLRAAPDPDLTAPEGSAADLNRALVRMESGWAAFVPRPDTSYHHYIVVFKGRKEDDRRPDQNLLRGHGAVEHWYLGGARGTSVWMLGHDVATLGRDSSVAWIDSAILGRGHRPLSEVTGWSYLRHRFDVTHAAGWTGAGGVRVAVIGDGIQCSLAEIPCGVGADVLGGDPYNDGGTSHETAIASVIAAQVNNGIGIRGAAPSVTIHSIGAYNGVEITCPAATGAIDIAANPAGPIRAHVINYSYGGYGYGECPSLDAVIYGNYQVPVVAAAGNDGIGTVMYPASNPSTIAVSATTSEDRIWADGAGHGSNYGPAITLAAGGKAVRVLDYTGDVETVNGTSIAAPHVAAAIAVIVGWKLWSQGCVPDRSDIVHALTSSAVPPAPPFMRDWYGAGILDAAAAVDSAIAQDYLICLDPGW